MDADGKHTVMMIYNRLLDHFGPQQWWPGDTNLEILVGAILTQGVAWRNVEKAMDNLKTAGKLGIDSLAALSDEELAEFIRPTLYHRQKARKVKGMMQHIIDHYDSSLDMMLKTPTLQLRQELLQIWGIGPETADSILLYAGQHRIFVVDAYTRRIFSRLGMVPENITYGHMQAFMEARVPAETRLYNEYHALLVALGAVCCGKTRPRCKQCPVSPACKYPEQEKNARR